MRINRKFVQIWAVLLIFAVTFVFAAPSNAAIVEAGKTYHITAWSAAGGTITDEGTMNIREGKDVTYHIYPESGHVVNYVMVDDVNVGPVTEYTFEDLDRDHEIRAYFITEAGSKVSSKKSLTVVGSYSLTNGTGSYAPNAKVTIDAGAMPGFYFAGWIASDGKIYPSARTTISMPNYDLILYAKWMVEGGVDGLNQIATTNLKKDQVYGWSAIADKLATFTSKDTQSGNSAALEVNVSGFNCYVDAGVISVLNTRQGVTLNISYGADVSYTFLSDLDNSMFLGTELSYTSTMTSTGILREKQINFVEQGAIGTGIFANIRMPEAAVGQSVYVYLVDAGGNEIFYMPAVVDAANRVCVPLSAKINLKIKY